jgi:hypothetical protein
MNSVHRRLRDHKLEEPKCAQGNQERKEPGGIDKEKRGSSSATTSQGDKLRMETYMIDVHVL